MQGTEVREPMTEEEILAAARNNEVPREWVDDLSSVDELRRVEAREPSQRVWDLWIDNLPPVNRAPMCCRKM